MNAIAKAAASLAALAVGIGAGCSSSRDPGAVGAIRVSVTAADVASIGVAVTGPGISTAITAELSRSGAEWTGTLGGVPVGADRTVSAEARTADGAVVYRGAATGVAVQEGATATVVLVLQEVEPPPPYTNTAPVIDSVYASDLTPQPGDTVTLTVTAHDPDPGAVLSYEWTASGGSFTPTPASQPTVQWTAPAAEGQQTLTVHVTDEKGLSTSLSFTASVAIAAGSVSVNAVVNTWPVVTAMTAAPTQAQVGASVALTAAASDADGDALTLAWSSSCPGTFSTTAGSACAFTPAAVPANNLCTVVVSVSDGRGGAGSGSVGFWVGLDVVQPSETAVAVAPRTTFVEVGATVSFAAAVTGAVDTSVIWAVQEGTAGGTITGAGVYTAPPTPGTYHVVATSAADPTRSDVAEVRVGDLAADLAALSQRAIYFGHQSVGSNILDGVATLLAANTGPEPRLVDTASATSMGTGIWAESSNGTNTDPISKIDAFDATLRGGVGGAVGIAFFKFCFIDLDNSVPYFVSGGTPATLFAAYRARLDALRALYPAVTFVHFTAPLRTDASSNQRREAFNQLGRTSYAGVEPVFDLARLESTDPDGNPVVGTYGPALYAGYTADGGHLNAAAAQKVARALVAFLAAL